MEQKILIVDDEARIRKIFAKILEDEGYVVSTVDNAERAIAQLDKIKPFIILMDQNMPGMNGIEAMKHIHVKYPDIAIIIITAYGEISLAVKAVKEGAYDYIEKPVDNDKLVLLINRAKEHFRVRHELKTLKQKISDKNYLSRIVAESEKMNQVIEQVKSVGDTYATVLIQGESGTGKDLIANAIHHYGERQGKPFISVNCGAIPITLIESELFGHTKGAFTDAREAKQGKFVQAHNGSLFLDEIAELPLDAQVKLLRVLEEKKIFPLGGGRAIPIDVRIIAATNNNLENKVQKGEFRLDLLYRLNIFTINIPPLRERREDIPILVDVFLNQYNEQFGLAVNNISKEALENILGYSWPGNIRDLQNALQSAMILSKKGTITMEHLPLRIKGYDQSIRPELSLVEGLERNMKQVSTKAEKEIILEALKECRFNRTRTADFLKISRKTLFNKMKQYNIDL
ncbi:MAG: sigma-54-dependent Fis family transcriptional regulator [Bacteroidetes bacterium]|jgi:DNA-binding NtrC family response regulator|nr:sigma-54-dependent Fis family transcriptional regulator [Bacteroidota bacterium]MBT3748332.1 sigma-54-dependent Fis family transcriptional regulator [Bacteroidota bacterium]MBT4399408.1 sigma-54-dependent Fis family transcriptional regulator [Bacteroidota bacterium]MBT4412399.1 sigma-54-dependent Fis family transcriptional regulator [Bacteroidota bacterium]MBT7093844.1 sigma-54-dependent Fis family transcriptional regulator [Bacteroidota bacterium]